MSNPFVYTFATDRSMEKGGTYEMTHDEYLRTPELTAAVRDKNNFRLFCGRKIYAFSGEFLRGNRELAETMGTLEKLQRQNPLMFYAPNSQEQLDLINDDDGTAFAAVDSNRCGKSSAIWIKALVGIPLIPCVSTWEIFTEHGIRYREFMGPRSIGVATYNTAKLQDPIWKEIIRKWTPDSELGIHGRTYKKRDKRFEPSWGHDRTTRLTCGSTIGYYTYEMDQGNYEGGALDAWMWDEQGREAMFDGADRGTRTTDGKHFFSLTPHHVPGRSDSGAHGWIHEMLEGRRAKGHTIKVYSSGNIRDVPDWIYPEWQKDMEFEKWEHEPKRTGDEKTLAEGRARLYGEWHYTSGLVLDEWRQDQSFIEPMWVTPPHELTLYRGLDHGVRNPTACLWAAVDKHGNIFIYREYQSRGKTIYQNVRAIVEMSGNSLKKMDGGNEPTAGIVMDRFEEQYETEHIAGQRLDSRSFAMPDATTGKPCGQIYKWAGLRVQKASGKFSDHWVPMVQEYLRPSPDRRHPVTGETPAPRLYVFSTCPTLKRQIESYVWADAPSDKEDPKETPRKKDDHLISCAQYLAQIPLRWHGDVYWPDEPEKEHGDIDPVLLDKRRKARQRETAYRRV